MELDYSNKGFKAIKIELINSMKKNNNNKKMTNNILKNTFIFGIFLISYYLYYLSLEKCYEGADICCKKLNWIKTKLIQELVSCALISILFQLLFYKIISRFHLIHLIIVFISFYKYSHGLVFDDHGYFNFIGFIGICIIIIIFFLPMNGFIYFNKKRNKKFLLYYILSIITIFHLIYRLPNSNFLNCDDWKYGLNNSYIQNNITKYGCQIIFPDNCPYKILKYFQDITKIGNIKCQNSKKDGLKKILEKSKSPYLNKNKTSKLIGYPLLNKASAYFVDYSDIHNVLYDYFLKNLVDMK